MKLALLSASPLQPPHSGPSEEGDLVEEGAKDFPVAARGGERFAKGVSAPGGQTEPGSVRGSAQGEKMLGSMYAVATEGARVERVGRLEFSGSGAVRQLPAARYPSRLALVTPCDARIFFAGRGPCEAYFPDAAAAASRVGISLRE